MLSTKDSDSDIVQYAVLYIVQYIGISGGDGSGCIACLYSSIWHSKQPLMAYNIHGENLERAQNSRETEFRARSELSPRMLYVYM